jgi:hypothetical protein
LVIDVKRSVPRPRKIDSSRALERYITRSYGVERCDTCCRTTRDPGSPGKVVYPRKKLAVRAAQLAGMDFYWHDGCRHWHLTSRASEATR